MDAVKAFNEELSGIYETKPPISRAKMTQLTKKAIKGIKFYKHIVQSMEKFVQKCRPEYKVPGLYVMDSVVRQSRHQFGAEKDVFMPRLCKNIISTFQHIYKCPPEDKPRILRVLNLWQKNAVFPANIVQQLTVMGGAPAPEAPQSSATAAATFQPEQTTTQVKSAAPDQANLTNILTNLLSNPDATQIQNLAGLLSSSQQNQLEDLLKQVKGAEQPNHKEPSPQPQVNIMPQGNTYQAPPPPQRQDPPYMQTQSRVAEQKPAFNREVLDFDYSDEEMPPAKIAKQSHSIDPSLLAKLPTADQIQQLTSANHSSAHKVDRDNEQRHILEQEQEIFNKQIQEIEERSKKSTSRSDREDAGSRRRRRSRSRSRSRDRHRHHRRRSHSRDRHRSRRSRSRDKERKSRRSRSRSHERRRERKGFPPTKDGYVSVCSTTLWIGNIAAKVMQHELQALVEEYGKVESINMIPPRGCAYVCMKERQEADRALHKIKYCRLNGKALKCDWAPGKEMPEEQKISWVKDLGVNYVELTSDPTLLQSLSRWGFVDPESVPEHRRDELKSPEPEPASEPEKPAAVAQPQMIQSFSPAVAPSVAAMVPQPQMPVMVRPFQLASFGMQQRMRVQQPGVPVIREPSAIANATAVSSIATSAVPPTVAPVVDTSVEMTVDSPEGRTPTADEQTDEPAQQGKPLHAQPQPGMTQFQTQFRGVSVAQRFPGTLPVQMMPNMNQQLMQSRMGMMPIRMGIPMQIRPGFHPGMQAGLPMQGRPQMMPGHPMRPPMNQGIPPQHVGGYHPGMRMRMGMPGQHPMARPQIPNMPPNRMIADDRRSTTPAKDEAAQDQPKDLASPPPEPRRRGFHDGPPVGPRGPLNRPPFNFGQPRFGGPNRFERPPLQRPPLIRQPEPMNRSPNREMNMSPSRDTDREPCDRDHPPRDLDRPPRGDMDRPPRDMDRPPRDMDRPPRDMDRPPREMDRPARDMDRPSRDFGDRPPRDFSDRPPREFGDRPPRDFGDRPPRDFGDRPPRDYDRPPRDRRDFDRGRRERSRDRDRRDRDVDRRGRDREDRDRDDRGRRDFDRGGREFDRRGGRPFRGRDDRGRGGRGGFRGGRGGGFRGGRGVGGGFGFGRGRGRRSPEVDPADLEYQRKREETLRKRHEEDDDYVVEEIDYSAFGLPSGFGGAVGADDKDTNKEDDDGKQRDRSPRRDRPRRDSEEKSRHRVDASPERRDRGEDPGRSGGDDVSAPSEDRAEMHASAAAQSFNGSNAADRVDVSEARNAAPCDDITTRASDVIKDSHRSPGTPTFDEQANLPVNEQEMNRDNGTTGD